jgi:hypothetical protein
VMAASWFFSSRTMTKLAAPNPCAAAVSGVFAAVLPAVVGRPTWEAIHGSGDVLSPA